MSGLIYSDLKKGTVQVPRESWVFSRSLLSVTGVTVRDKLLPGRSHQKENEGRRRRSISGISESQKASIKFVVCGNIYFVCYYTFIYCQWTVEQKVSIGDEYKSHR